jgi:hypothetical protein
MEKCLQSRTDAPIFLAVIGPGASSTTMGARGGMAAQGARAAVDDAASM